MKLAPLLLAALLLTGCTSRGGSDDTASSEAAAPASADGGASSDDVSSGVTSGGGELAAPGQADGAPPLARVGAATSAVVRTGSMEVVVDDVAAAADEAARLVVGAQGQVEADERASDGGPERAVLRLRVPPAAFDATVGRLAALGEERSRRLGSEDVTEQVVDLDSRLATQRASVERVRALLAGADTLGEVVTVEAELTRRTADLESLEARLGALTARVALGTIELRLTASEDAPAAAGGPLGFQDGLREGWDALRAVGRAVGVTAGALLPWSPVLLLAGLLVWRSRRRPA
ncbi:MAG: hypothetical protein JWN08_3270 [Frankiales bacterium]|nr:hypothetical protein [Frankiales bacterium]